MWNGSWIRLTARQPYASPPGYQSLASGDNVPNPGSQDTTGAQPHHGSTLPSPCHNNDNLVNSTPCLLLSCTHQEDANASSISQFVVCVGSWNHGWRKDWNELTFCQSWPNLLSLHLYCPFKTASTSWVMTGRNCTLPSPTDSTWTPS